VLGKRTTNTRFIFVELVFISAALPDTLAPLSLVTLPPASFLCDLPRDAFGQGSMSGNNNDATRPVRLAVNVMATAVSDDPTIRDEL